MVIVTDDESRENEGDLVAASKVTAEVVNQMALHARGLICVPMLSDQLRRLGINQWHQKTVNHSRLTLPSQLMQPKELLQELRPRPR